MDRLPGFRGEFLWELDIVDRQTIALAEALPDDHYHWRPHPEARSVSEVFVHVATGNFMLLHFAGFPAPAELYPGFAAEEANLREGWESRFAAFIRHNDELVANTRDKLTVLTMLKRSFETVRSSFKAADLDRPLFFFGENTTLRRVYMRLICHAHEHMGQMIAYTRAMGLTPPWPDWRSDRRPQRAAAKD